MHKIFALLCNYNIISERTYDAVLQKLVVSEISQGTILVSPGSPQEKVYFLGEGITRNFYSYHEQEWTHSFDTAGDCIMTSAQFIHDEESMDYVETCTDIELYSISKKDFQVLMLGHPELIIVSQKIIERRLMRLEKRMQDLYTLKEEELYFKFRREYPGVFGQISDQYIASYLRISPALLSKLKKKPFSETAG